MTGEDGVVYRWFAAHGFQFHPLANFATLNGHAKNQRREEADSWPRQCSPAGQGRAHAHLGVLLPLRRPGTLDVGARPGAGAQALARTGALLEDDALLAGAGDVPGDRRDRSQSLGGGTWVKEYSYPTWPS